MKTTEKEGIAKPGSSDKPGSQNGKHPQLKTDYPLSEKDEVKQAEAKMAKSRRGIL